MPVDTQHSEYTKYQPKWKRAADVIEGQDAVHQAGTAYLPKLKDQADEDYQAYVKRAGFYNATWRTIAGLVGMVFRKPPTQDLPAALKVYTDDIDMSGTTLDQFAKCVVEDVLGMGRIGILVDFPTVDFVGPVSLADAEKAGMRPALHVYEAMSIINWKTRRVNNRTVLSMVVLAEGEMEAKDEFEDKEIKQWRVLDLDEDGFYRVRVFRKGDKNEDVEISDVAPLMRGKRIPYIPFCIVGPDGVEIEPDEPPLIDLIDVNLSHYRTNADYEHGCHFTGLPTPVVSGYTPANESDKLYIGSTSAWVFTDPQAKASYLEFSGAGLSELRENMGLKEQRMAVLGARMLATEKRKVETAEKSAIDRASENSVLSSIALSVSQALEWALGVFGEWVGASGKVTYQLNRDYLPVMIDAPTLTALVGAVQAGKISDAEFYELMQRGDVIDSTKPFEEHQAEVEMQGPARPDVGMAA